MRKTMALHVRYKSLFNSLPYSVKHQRELTEFKWIFRYVIQHEYDEIFAKSLKWRKEIF